jgi:hypothetical protein
VYTWVQYSSGYMSYVEVTRKCTKKDGGGEVEVEVDLFRYGGELVVSFFKI